MSKPFDELFKPRSIISKNEVNIFSAMNQLVLKNNSMNFGQGFPTWSLPTICQRGLEKAITYPDHQYPRPNGSPEQVESIAKLYSRPEFLNTEINAMTEVLVGSGATTIQAGLFAAFLEPNDEVVCFTPFFPFYKTQVDMHYGVLKTSELKLENLDDGTFGWKLDINELDSLLGEKTKFLILNNPMNPNGKLWTKEEYTQIANLLLEKYPHVCVIADEVYEFTNLHNQEFVRFSSIPNMKERTVSVFSGGKLFSCTGWRVGWAIGPEHIIKNCGIWCMWNVFGLNRQSGKAMHFALEEVLNPYEGKSTYLEWLNETYNKKIERFYNIVAKYSDCFGWKVIKPNGGFFTMIDITSAIQNVPVRYFYNDYENVKDGEKTLEKFEDWVNLENPEKTPDTAFATWMTIELGVTPLPCYPFYIQQHDEVKKHNNVNLIRFAHCKNEETQDQLEVKLENFRSMKK